MRRHGLSIAALALLGPAAGCALPDFNVDRPNHAPEAALRAPVIAPVGVPVRFDASDSFDSDADPLTFRFEVIGYASLDTRIEPVSSNDPVVQLVFPADGLYTVEVLAIDLLGEEGLARQDVAARLEFPDPPDFCTSAADCVVGDECEYGMCYSRGGSVAGAVE